MGWGDYDTTEVRALKTIRKVGTTDYNKDFVRNITDLNASTQYIADYMIVMQGGIDDANKDILHKIQDFINDVIIIFGGGDYGDSGFDFGDLGYILQAIGALFGFSGISGPINPSDSAGNFLTGFLAPLGIFGDIINGFIQAVFSFFAGLLSSVPIVGSTLSAIVTNTASGINGIQSTATTANSTANTANTTANTANTNATTAISTATTAINTANSAATAASAATSSATAAVSAASAAANAAAAAQATADIAYGLSSYWEAECVVSSAEVLSGVNELLIGLCQNVPSDRSRKVTDIHFALVTQPGGMTIQTKKYNAAGTSSSVIHTATLGANVTRVSYSGLTLAMADKERVFWNVSSITGTVAPTVLQCLLFGVIVGL